MEMSQCHLRSPGTNPVIGRISFSASLRVTTQFIGHNVQMTGIGFVTLAEILKYLNINMLRKSVIGRNEAIPHKFTGLADCFPEYSVIFLMKFTLYMFYN